ncbi:relaxase domain-containing protein [Iamia sp. SCSIO 61187]|uniref:MobF family relaxase n=1 Tax=Iamia sp. SCSIO 61187 TaxID=2722752 RepID=UPI001C62CD14|nr:MobF family relaxase [Iamia sp. SCSIO 61187]QYG93247.1 relaxase domain-containing protein [Iamia sp. SCSIO 61187]
MTTLRGPDAGAYYVDGPGGYYLDGDEPPGQWLGLGAEALGLAGQVDDDPFLALMDGRDPIDGALLGTSHHERTVRGFDVTCSAPKSVSVLFAIGDERIRKDVLDAHDAAVAAAFGWIEDHAHCRYRVDGEIWTVDADGLIAAAFRQHTSRAHDPQVHTHLVIVNRVMAPDGRWLALDARTLKHDQRAVSALYAAGLRAELTSRLGVRWNEVESGQAEMADAPEEVLDAFSQRTKQMARRVDEKTERFVDDLGRRPTPRERWRIEREAVTDSRPTKVSADAAELHQDWHDQLDALGYSPARYLDRVTGRARPIEGDAVTDRDTVIAALSSLRDTQSVWRPAEITREIAAALPTRLGGTAGETVGRAQRLASHVEDAISVDVSQPVPDHVPVRDDGRPVTEGALDRILTTRSILHEEEHILELTQRWAAEGGSDVHDLDSDDELSAVQQHAAGAVAGERRMVLVVGPAGTGKTTAMRPAVAHLQAQERSCFGVAPSAAAAEVLAVDTGIDADTLDKLLVEHRLDRPPQHRYDLPTGTTVVVDEAAMVPTPRLAELIDLADRRDWRLALIGDPMQFSAVGRSGMFGHLVDMVGAVELDRVHRFDASWERDASLRLRRGDTDVVALYDHHDRFHGGTGRQMAKATVAAWRRATEAGETAAMMAPTRAGVDVLNELAQHERIAAGEIDLRSRSVKVGASRAFAGDLVATRRNDRTLLTDQARMVKNRDHWTVETVHDDGGLTVAGRTGRVTLPADYVAAHVELAYAETSHATQGRTVDRSFLFLDGPTGTSGIYVPLTRGRTSNEAFVVLNDERTAAEVVAEAVARTWIDQPATALRLDRPKSPASPGDGSQDAAIRPCHAVPSEPLPERELRALVRRASAHRATAERISWRLRDHDRALADLAWREGELQDQIRHARTRLADATRTLDERDSPLHRRHHRAEIASAKREVESLPGWIDDLESELTELPDAIEAARSAREQALRLDEAVRRSEPERVEHAIEADARARGMEAADQPTSLLVAHLGPVPDDPTARGRWIEAAGRVAQHHALWDLPDDSLIGPCPPVGERGYDITYYAASRAVSELAPSGMSRSLGAKRAEQGLSL